MSVQVLGRRSSWIRWGLLGGVCLFVWGCLAARSAAGDETSPQASEPEAQAAQTAQGRELFTREWLPNDPRAHGGDGLGPVFNDTSCVACHNQGGIGGSGPGSKNVDVLSAFRNEVMEAHVIPHDTSVTESIFRGLFGLTTPPRPPAPKAKRPNSDHEELAKLHPGFRTARSIVLHKFGTDGEYQPWRVKLIGHNDFMRGSDEFVQHLVIRISPDSAGNTNAPQAAARATAEFERQQARGLLEMRDFFTESVRGNFRLLTSKRNPTALFGAGLIDRIRDEELEAAAARKHKDFPGVSGRVSRLPNGKIGRFGWKGQTASLFDFAMTACAVELGLHVPDHPQAGLPHKADYKAPGLDMTQEECVSLVAYLSSLPAPRERISTHPAEAEMIRAGRTLFHSVGCAACHVPNLGNVEGIYSDLLLHDLGPELGDTGNYGVFVPESPGAPSAEPEEIPQFTTAVAEFETPPAEPKDNAPATQLEWRTPPLWGLRDSAPYLHDGRAHTIEEAIALHGGEADESSLRYFRLSHQERQQFMAFLKSLVAPEG